MEPALLELVGTELGRSAAIGRHRPVAGRGERDDDAGSAVDWSRDFNPVLRELARGELARGVGAALADEARLRTERRRPGGDVRCLTARTDARLRSAVRTRRERRVEPHDHVEQEVAERRHAHT